MAMKRIAAGLVSIAVVTTACGGTRKPNQAEIDRAVAAALATVTTAAATTTTTAAPTTTTTAAIAATTAGTTAAAGQWAVVANFSGTGPKNTAQFTFQGGQQRVTWRCSPSSVSYINIITPSGGSAGPGDSIDCATPNNNSSSLIYFNAGPYYLNFNLSSDTTWNVKIEEMR